MRSPSCPYSGRSPALVLLLVHRRTLGGRPGPTAPYRLSHSHIEGTDTFIPFDSILDSPDLPTDRSTPIALYCRSGNMSAQAAADLVADEYTNVVDLESGMHAWDSTGNTLLDDPTATAT